MTAADNLCDVCGHRPMIGVASTMIPYSCAYCVECATRQAQPELVFECWYDDFGTDYDQMHPGLVDVVVTFKDGRYMSYREWTTAYKPAGDSS